MAVIPCVCPPKADGEPRHPNGDKVNLRPKLDFKDGLWLRQSIIRVKQNDAESDEAEMLAVLTEASLLAGIESWTLTDAKGKPVDVDRTAIRAFMNDHQMEATAVGDEAIALYYDTVIGPLVAAAQTSSQPTPITASISPMNGPSRQARRQSKRSSTTTTPTADTERMSASPGGGYSS